MNRHTPWSCVALLSALTACAPVPPWTMDNWDAVVTGHYQGDGTVLVHLLLRPPANAGCPWVPKTLRATLGSDVELEQVMPGGLSYKGCDGVEYANVILLSAFTSTEHNTVTITDGPWSARVTVPTLHVERRFQQEPLDVQPDGTVNVWLYNDRLLVFVWSEPTDTPVLFAGGVTVDGTEHPSQFILERGIRVDLPVGTLGAHTLSLPGGRATTPVTECVSLARCEAEVFASDRTDRVVIQHR